MNPSHQTTSRRRHAEALVLLAGLVLMAYANSFGAGFTRDNRPLILDDPRVHSVSRQHLEEILTHDYWGSTFESGLYRPLTTLSFLLNYAVLEDFEQPAGYHWFNCLLHVANAFLVYLLVLLLVRQYWPALFAAALWALHPISTEAVTNIVGRPEELAALGVLAALLLYVRGARETGRRKVPWLAAMMAATTVAVFSKESGVMVLALAALYDFTYRIRRGRSFREMAKSFLQFFLEGYVYLALPVVIMLCARWAVLRHSGAMEIPFVDNPLSGADFLTGRATAIRVIGKYLGLLVWPRTLSVDYSYNQIPLLNWQSAWQEWIAVAAVLGLLLVAAACYRRNQAGFFLMGFSALTLLPAANLVVTTGTIMAERLLYLPSVGFAASVAIGIYSLARRLGLRPVVAAVALGAIGAAYGARTYQRNPDWQDDETLFASAVEAAPASFRVHLSLASWWYYEDPTFLQGDRAIRQAETAAAIVSGLPDSRTPILVFVILGALYSGRGDSLAPKDAEGNPQPDAVSAEWYRKALAVDLRGVAVDRAHNEDRRRAELAHGTPPDQVRLGMPDLYANLGNTYLRLGDPQQALQAFLYQRRLAPRMPQAYANIALAYLALNETEEAVTLLLESYTLDHSPETLSKIGELYGKIDSGSCAIARQTDRPSLNYDCAPVRRDLCNGYRDLVETFRDAKLRDLAERLRDSGRREAGCRMEPEGAAPPAPVRPAASRRPGPATEPAYPGPMPLCLRARKNLGFEDFQAGFGVADGVRTERTLASQRAEEFVGGPSMPFGHLRQQQS